MVLAAVQHLMWIAQYCHQILCVLYNCVLCVCVVLEAKVRFIRSGLMQSVRVSI